MKSLFGKVLAGALGFAAAIGISAFAAEINITVQPTDLTGKKVGDLADVVVTGTIEDGAEATILVAEDGKSLTEVTETDIRYINQDTVKDGSFTFTAKLKVGAKYNIWCGGTAVARPDEGFADLTLKDESKLKIVGSVTLLDGAQLSKVTAVAKAGGADVTGIVDASAGTYAIEVEPGTYTVVVGRPGYLYRTFNGVEVKDANVTLAPTALLAGDLQAGDDEVVAIIDLRDLQPLLYAYGTKVSEEGFDELADLNDDGVIDLRDLQALLYNYGVDAATGYNAE